MSKQRGVYVVQGNISLSTLRILTSRLEAVSCLQKTESLLLFVFYFVTLIKTSGQLYPWSHLSIVVTAQNTGESLLHLLTFLEIVQEACTSKQQHNTLFFNVAVT